MEELKKKTWLIKIPASIYEKLGKEMNEDKIGKIIIQMNDKESSLESNKINIILNKRFQTNNYELKYEKNDYFFGFENPRSEGTKPLQLDYTGKLIFGDLKEIDKLNLPISKSNLNGFKKII